ncbi:hypothetical protein ZWY2020_036336 [Hordeum vulgare]|nr:hypothetical protein ZWY2020_036336 [Hordeum vulgare]
MRCLRRAGAAAHLLRELPQHARMALEQMTPPPAAFPCRARAHHLLGGMRGQWLCTAAGPTGAHNLSVDQHFTVVPGPGPDVSKAAGLTGAPDLAVDQDFTVVPGPGLDVSEEAERVCRVLSTLPEPRVPAALDALGASCRPSWWRRCSEPEQRRHPRPRLLPVGGEAAGLRVHGRQLPQPDRSAR